MGWHLIIGMCTCYTNLNMRCAINANWIKCNTLLMSLNKSIYCIWCTSLTKNLAAPPHTRPRSFFFFFFELSFSNCVPHKKTWLFLPWDQRLVRQENESVEQKRCRWRKWTSFWREELGNLLGGGSCIFVVSYGGSYGGELLVGDFLKESY